MASMRAYGLIRSLRAGYCRLPITSYNVNTAYRNHFTIIRLNSGVAGSSSNSDNISAITTAATSPKEEDAVASVAEAQIQFKWETVAAEVVKEPALTGAIIPFAQQSFIQKLFMPYTYAVMYYMDFLTSYMPWWAAIVGTTATCKVVFFPLLVRQQQIGHKLHNLLPETQKLQTKLNDAMCAGDAYNTALYRSKMKLLFDENNLGMKARLMPALVQAPMFMSLFFLLRKLTSQPVESLLTGGALWFTDLTVPDPYFILPVITCASLFALLELGLGVEGASGGPSSTMRPIGRWVMRGMPLVLFAVIYNFPAATLLFWTTNNVSSLVTALIMKRPSVMRKLNIPERIKHPPESLPLTNQSLTSQLKAAKEMGQASKTTMDIRRLDDIAFKKAGVGPLKKTYRTPPIKEVN